ncbi:unnamed protein product [Oncorhynchus mykiss]|uniref:Protein Wnt n=1 Tax=Oncorhynchus mykiss TaxID=8022 RepID=A0A060Y9F8_ONCMY|nr:unnamed protein product [Oncorhynchus mykiss]
MDTRTIALNGNHNNSTEWILDYNIISTWSSLSLPVQWTIPHNLISLSHPVSTQDCGLVVQPDQPCGLEPLPGPLSPGEPQAPNQPCISGDVPGRWVVPCLSCADNRTCDWREVVWQPEGCYHPLLDLPQLQDCMMHRKVMFIGDSTNRGMMYFLMERVNSSLEDWGKAHDSLVYRNVNQGHTHVSYSYYPQHTHTHTIPFCPLSSSRYKEQSLAVAKTMATDCRCHGVSGSCAVKTCWRTMASFERVGNFLKERYEGSVQVLDRSKRKVRRKEKDQRRVPIGKEELIFLNKSPNYCLEDRRWGVAGTRGRRCNRTSAGPDGCNLLCCGRGYNTHVVRHVERCECKFVWCCYKCESMNDMHTCK